MATRNDRDVRLGVEISTTGEDSLRRMGDAVRGLGDAGGEAAPDLQRLRTELDSLTATTEARRRAESAARTDATAARAAFDQQRDALSRLRAESDRSTRSSAEYQAAERGLKVAVNEARIALRERSAAVRAASAETRAAVGAERQHADAIRQTAAAARASSQAQVQSLTPVATAVQSLTGQLSTLRNIAGAAIGGTLVTGLARDVAGVADAYAGLSAKIKLATGDGAAFDQTLQGVVDIALRTGVEVEKVGTLYTRLAQASKSLGLSNEETLALAETVTQALQLSGATAQEAAASVTQFAQAIASGRLAGDELRSLLEGAPRLAQALADGLGVTVGRLRELGTAGALSAEQVIGALRGQGAAIEQEFSTLPVTLGRAINNLGSAFTVYVGQLDKATGASSAAASVISALARNLDVVGAALFSAGKAVAAYSALNLAKSFIESATAARTVAAATAAATAATAGHTLATVANTTAQTANAAATAGTVASAGRLAGVLSSLKTLSFLAVVTNLREIGTALGEGTAKLFGYGRAFQELEITQRASEQAARASAQAHAEQAQRTQQAADAALGLTDASRKVIAEFDGMVRKGESATDALAKLAKALELGDISGIAAAGAALDALAVRGTLSAEQVRVAYTQALAGIDLGRFETEARAAFDGSEQGARRLAAALDATLAEALHRAGSSAEELSTGFSRAATSALNDFDKLADNLGKLGGTAEDVGRVLGVSLDKALAAASTERAVRAVIERVEALGRAGTVTGDQLADGLDKARRKLDEIKPGVSSLEEAFRQLGLKAPAELQRLADANRDAFQRIANDGTVALSAKQEAFRRYSEAAIAANGGVVTSELRVQAAMQGLTITVDETGRAIVKAAGDGAGAMDRLAGAANRARDAIQSAADTSASLSRLNAETTRYLEEQDAARNARNNEALRGEIATDSLPESQRGQLGVQGRQGTTTGVIGSTRTLPPGAVYNDPGNPGAGYHFPGTAGFGGGEDAGSTGGLLVRPPPPPPAPAPAPTPRAPAPAPAPVPAPISGGAAIPPPPPAPAPVGEPIGSLTPPPPPPAPPAPAPAPVPTGPTPIAPQTDVRRVEVVLSVAGQPGTSTLTGTDAQADALLSMLEAAQRSAGVVGGV